MSREGVNDQTGSTFSLSAPYLLLIVKGVVLVLFASRRHAFVGGLFTTVFILQRTARADVTRGGG